MTSRSNCSRGKRQLRPRAGDPLRPERSSASPAGWHTRSGTLRVGGGLRALHSLGLPQAAPHSLAVRLGLGSGPAGPPLVSPRPPAPRGALLPRSHGAPGLRRRRRDRRHAADVTTTRQGARPAAGVTSPRRTRASSPGPIEAGGGAARDRGAAGRRYRVLSRRPNGAPAPGGWEGGRAGVRATRAGRAAASRLPRPSARLRTHRGHFPRLRPRTIPQAVTSRAARAFSGPCPPDDRWPPPDL